MHPSVCNLSEIFKLKLTLYTNNIILPLMQMTLLPKKEMKYFKSWTHGGVSLKKRRKIKRPLLPNVPTHLVLKSRKATGKLSFYTQKKLVESLLKQKSRKFFIEILEFVNMGNHLHLKVRFKEPKKFQQFLKSFTSLLARKITGAKKGHKFGKFWDGLAFTRVITSRFEELQLKGYFEGNHLQRELGQAKRDFYLTRFNQFLYRLKQTRAAPQNNS